MRMTDKTRKLLAEGFCEIVRNYVAGQLLPLQQRLSALEGELAMTQAKLAELEAQRPALRRIA